MLDDQEMDGNNEESNEESNEDIAQRLDSISLLLAKSRSEAIQGRQVSGIEDEWTEDEEYCEGIDDANRSEFRAWRTKPPGQGYVSGDKPTGSTVFINITAQYCDGVSARIGDMLLPTDDSAFQIKPTPVPELAQIAKGDISAPIKNQIQQGLAFNTPEMAQEVEKSVISNAQQQLDEAKQKADNAQKRIEDWHVECQFHGEVRSVIEDCSKIGSGILKGPFPERRKHVAYIDGELVVSDEIKPASRRIDPWNFYPDPGCGQNIHNGGYVWERDDITSKQLEGLKGNVGYIDTQIDKVLKEGPHRATHNAPERTDVDGLQRRETKNLFEIWYYHGQVSKADLIAALQLSNQAEGLGYSDDYDGETIDVQATMVNNTLIRLVTNPLETGDFPYDVMVIKRRAGMPWGYSISRQVRTPQRIVNGAARNLMDNAGIAGGPMLVFKQGIITPANGIAEIMPRKIWYAAEDADIEDVSKAITYIVSPMTQVELQAIIFMGMKLAEDVVGLPMIMQGQMGQTTPDRVGVVQILNQNASTVLRRIARLFDDLLTEPHVRRYYRYLMQYGEDNEKGEFVIDARGSSALVERQIESQEIMAMSQLVNNPTFGIDPKKWASEFLKSKHLDPKRFEYDDKEWQQVVQQLSQPQQQDPRLEIANLNAQLKQGMEQAKAVENDKDRQFEAWKLQTGNEFEGAMIQFEAEMEREMKMMEQSGQKDISLDRARDVFTKAKTDLANNVLRLKTQKELAGVKSPQVTPQVAVPAVEPVGIAPNGQAFQR